MGRLFWKIFLCFWATLLLVGGAVGIIVWLQNSKRINELELLVNNPRAEMGVAAIANALRYGGEAAVKEIQNNQKSRHIHNRPVQRVLIVNDNDQDLLGRPVPKATIERARLALNTPEQGATQQVVSPSGKRYTLFVPQTMSRPFRRTAFSAPPIPPLIVPFVASIIFSAWLAWYLTRPISLIRKGARKLAGGALETRIVPDLGGRKDELADLGKEFDDMAAKIGRLLNDQQRLLNDVSHELRSPLARIQLAIELSRQQPARKEELIGRIEKESERLDLLVGDLLTLSRLESQSMQHPATAVDIKALIADIAEDAAFEAERRSVSLHVACAENLITQGHQELLHRALENCVRNAVAHSPQQGEVKITANAAEGKIEITISDQGEGVPPEQLEALFQPFVQFNPQSHHSGYCLGLSIAKRAITLHHGTISAANQKAGGLSVSISLPSHRRQRW